MIEKIELQRIEEHLDAFASAFERIEEMTGLELEILSQEFTTLAQNMRTLIESARARLE